MRNLVDLAQFYELNFKNFVEHGALFTLNLTHDILDEAIN